MKKKALSLALALVMCLGLTVPAFAAETYTDTYEGITVTAQPNGSVSYTGAGELTGAHAEIGANAFLTATDGAESASTASISVGQGLTVTDEFKEVWSEIANYYGFSVSYGSPATPAQPEQPQQSAENTASNGAQVSGWAKDRVNVALDNDLVPNSLGNDYRVNITRAQFAFTAVMLFEAMGGDVDEATGESSFTDTDDPVILLAADLGFVSGVGGGRFDPDALVTREQAAVMLSSVYTRLGGEIPTVEATTFADNSAVSSWARNAVAFMSGKEIVTGVGNNNFSPKGGAKIEEALLVSLKMFEVLK